MGQQGLTTSAIGYGSMGATSFYCSSNDRKSIAAIQKAHDVGVTFFDTAEMYGWGANEELFGEAREALRRGRRHRHQVQFTRDFGVDSRPEHIREVVNKSLTRLGVDQIDLLYQHRPDLNVPIEDVAGTVQEFIAAGKVKYFGLSEAGPETMRRAARLGPPD